MDGPILSFLQNIPAELATMILAMVPITELRASIPIGIKIFGLSPLSSFFWSVVGNVIPVVFLLLLIRPVSGFIHRHVSSLERILDWIHRHVQKKLKGKESLEGLALTLFVAIPLPGTGGWTAALIAFFLGLSFRRTFPFLLLGIIIAGLIVTLISTGIFASLNFLLD